MKYATLILFYLLTLKGHAQNQTIRDGNKLFEGKKYPDAEKKYREAIKTDPKSFEGNYNLGNSLFEQKKYDDAAKQFQHSASETTDKVEKSKALYNLGNTFLAQNKLDESIKAYKEALVNRPADKEAQYNLSYALQKKKEQEQKKKQQEQDQQPDKQNKDKDKNKKDGEKEQDKQKQDPKQNPNNGPQNNPDKPAQDKKKPADGGMSDEDIKRNLEALRGEEQKARQRMFDRNRQNQDNVSRSNKPW